MKKLLAILCIVYSSSIIVSGQGLWSQKANLPDTGREGGIGFSIGNYGYVGLGCATSNKGLHGFWQFNPSTNKWTKKADYPGNGLCTPATFVIGHKAYIVAGAYTVPNTNPCKETWEYDANNNVWTRKADLPGISKTTATGFSVGSKGYVGTGQDSIGNFYNDFYEYDTATNSWTKKNDFPGSARIGANGFSVGGKGYLCYGYCGTGFNKDIWQYDTGTDSWTQKSNCPDSFHVAAGFVISDNIYVGTGQHNGGGFTNAFWKYNPLSDIWTKQTNFDSSRACCYAFAISDTGYLGLGWDYSAICYNDWYKFYPDTLTSINEINLSINNISIYPNPSNGIFTFQMQSINQKIKLEIYNMLGEKVYNSQCLMLNSKYSVDINNQAAGIYLYRAISETGEQMASGKLMIEK